MSVSTLQAAPFNLALGSSVFAQVFAINAIGNGTMSQPGNGAIISVIVVPSAPTQVTRNAATSTPVSIGLTWLDGASNGGSPILDYTITFDQGNNGASFVIAAAGITVRNFVMTGL